MLSAYLAEWPEIANNDDVIIELIGAECRARAYRDRPPTKEDLERRFPAIASQLNIETFTAESEASNNSEVAVGKVAAPLSTHGTQPAPPRPSAQTTFPPHSRIGRYQIEGVLGRGGMSIVYLARDDKLDRLVAVKVLKPGQSESSKSGRTLAEDAKTLSKLECPGIVPVYDYGEDEDGVCFFVMKYVAGDSLAAILESRRVPCISKAVEWTIQAAVALHGAHQKGFTHRDIKPGNILIDESGDALIIDFGLAIHDSTQQNNAWEYAGTLAYMSPEQVRGESHLLDGRTDIWALGVVLFEMLAGRRPFNGETSTVLCEEILHRHPKPPRQFDEKIPAELERICLKCLSKGATERYSSAGDLAAELRRWQSRHKRRAVIFSGVAIAILLLLPVGMWLRGGSSRDAPRELTGMNSPPAPLNGTIDVVVWNERDPGRRTLVIRDPSAMPLRSDDSIRIQVQLDRDAYIYLLWIDSAGKVTPIYPWEPGNWDSIMNEETHTDISLPEIAGTAWPLRGAGGMETVVLLARETPLSNDVNLKQLLVGLPEQPMQNPKALVWFKNGNVITEKIDKLRGPQWFDAQKIDDDVYLTHQFLIKQLGTYFPLIVSNAFAYEGDSQ